VSDEDHGAVLTLSSIQQAQLDFWKDGPVQHDGTRTDLPNQAPRSRDDGKIVGQRSAPTANPA
jgi:hypothetical protein